MDHCPHDLSDRIKVSQWLEKLIFKVIVASRFQSMKRLCDCCIVHKFNKSKDASTIHRSQRRSMDVLTHKIGHSAGSAWQSLQGSKVSFWFQTQEVPPHNNTLENHPWLFRGLPSLPPSFFDAFHPLFLMRVLASWTFVARFRNHDSIQAFWAALPLGVNVLFNHLAFL